MIPKFQPQGWNIQDVNARVILEKVLDLKRTAKKEPAIVFDMDGTLFDVGHRTLGILREFLDSPQSKKFEPTLIVKLREIDYEHLGYSLSHAFENKGLNLISKEVAEVFTAAEVWWQKRFFDGKALVQYDEPVPGAQEFVVRCQQAGLKVVYLTGRARYTRMFDGTREQLTKFKFPTEGIELVMKGKPSLEDQAFKKEAYIDLCSRYSVVGNFENEYVNLFEMVCHDPGCAHVIVDSQHSARPVKLLPHPVYRIQNFTF